jgi:hypothetical protein
MVASGLLGLPLVEVTVAPISFVGQYSTSSFKISSGPGGTVGDHRSAGRPARLHRRGNKPRFQRTTDARALGGGNVGRSTPVAGGGPAANVALFANYMAASFVTGAHSGSNPLLAEELLHTQPAVAASPHR